MGGVGARSATCGVYPTLPKYLSNKLNIWIELPTTNETAGVQSGGVEGPPTVLLPFVSNLVVLNHVTVRDDWPCGVNDLTKTS